MTSVLQKVGAVGEVKPNLISYRASDFVEDLRKKIAQEFPNETAEINWNVQPGDAVLNIDPQLLQEAIIELLANAFRHDQVRVRLLPEGKGSTKTGSSLRFGSQKSDLNHPPKTGPGNRFEKVSQGHYGLGLRSRSYHRGGSWRRNSCSI